MSVQVLQSGLMLAAIVVGPVRDTGADEPFVLVSDFTKPGGRVQQFDLTGKHLGTFTSGGQLDGPGGLTLGPEGHIYVVSFNNHKLLRFAKDGSPQPGPGRSDGVLIDSGLKKPIAVTLDPQGNLLIACYAESGGYVRRFDAKTGAPLDRTALITGLAEPIFLFVEGGRLYVVSRQDGILRFDVSTGSQIDRFVPRPDDHSGLHSPESAFFGPDVGGAPGDVQARDGRPDLYVASRALGTTPNAGQIKVYSGVDGTFIRNLTQPSDDGGMDNPIGLRLLASGQMLVSSNITKQVLRLDTASGKPLGQFGQAGPELLNSPSFMLVVPEPAVLSLYRSDPAKMELFEKKVRPLLAKHCFKCHGEKKQEGELRLDSSPAMAQGGESGWVVTPGKPDQSLMIQAVRYSDELEMPPDNKLTGEEVQTLVAWVSSGALWPEYKQPPKPASLPKGPLFSEKDKTFWSFQPIQDPPPPAVKAAGWVSSPLDRFILSVLEREGLSPAPLAGKRTLIRRLSFDLTGLPPTPEEIDAFLADESPRAYAKLVDHLLDSPHYGERWGRHWLDVARYADTTGQEADFAYRDAWRYRDWVVRAINQDKPFDQFVIEQLAGDLLPPGSDRRRQIERIIGTGFLMLGPKALAEQDKDQIVLEIVDEQIDVVSKALLGLTVSCARCHDHKFDPIPSMDYYSLAGIFKSTKMLADREHTSMWVERSLERPGKEKLRVLAPLEGIPSDMPVLIRGRKETPGPMAPRRFLQIIAGENHAPFKTSQSGRLELARWIASPNNPLTARVMVNRIWQGHFGTGLVATSNNFGRLGEPPSHPNLLDWLASRFIQSGWSMKAMHRLIVHSSTYKMQSRYENARAQQDDPEGRLLWRFSRRRLAAGEIRDAMLAVSGRLDRQMGGSLLDLKTHGETVDAKRGLFAVVLDVGAMKAYQTPRRSIYIPIIRNQMHQVYQLFDYTDANTVLGKRNESIVAPQALFMMNSPFVRQQSKHLAEQLLNTEQISDKQRLHLAHRKLLGRPPSEQELAEGLDYVNTLTAQQPGAESPDQKTRLAAWQSYCQLLFSLNEFIYVD